jgi:hypothetical protein
MRGGNVRVVTAFPASRKQRRQYAEALSKQDSDE